MSVLVSIYISFIMSEIKHLFYMYLLFGPYPLLIFLLDFFFNHLSILGAFIN